MGSLMEAIFKIKKGFTLVELLIVVVIIAIMGTLILPLFTGQTEKARTTEALAMLSAIRRAQMRYNDAHKADDQKYAVIDYNCNASGEDVPANQQLFQELLGIQMPPCTSTKWKYEAQSPSTETDPVATAVRMGTGGAQGTLSIASNGTWSGTGDYQHPDSSGNGGGKYWPNLQR